MALPSRSHERFLLLTDLRSQLPRTRGSSRSRTEKAIRQLEQELAGGRDLAQKAATR